MSGYNPKNADAFNQVTLEEQKPVPINVVSVPGGSVVEKGSMSSPNYRESRSGWTLDSDGNAEFNNAVIRGTIVIGGEYVTVKTGQSIQEALDTVHASGGGTVVLENGTHYATSDITMYSNTTLQGQNRASSIIDFSGTSSSVVAQGSSIYSTGTVTISNNSQSVTGNGTAWLTNALAGMSILLEGIWYPIYAVSGDGAITIALPYGGTSLVTADYVLGYPIVNVYLKDLTISNSTDSGFKYYYLNDGGVDNVDILSCLVGFDMNYTAQCQMRQMTGAANYTNFKIFNTHYLAFWAAGCIDALAGHGFEIDNLTNSKVDSLFIINSAGDGLNIKNTKNVVFNFVSKENTGSGCELVSGNDMIALNACGVENNGDSGVKLTATSDNVFINNSLLKGNTGYGVNIVAATCDNTVITSNNFTGNTTSACNDSGTGTVIRGNVGLTDNSTSAQTLGSVISSYTADENLSAGEAVRISTGTTSHFSENGNNGSDKTFGVNTPGFSTDCGFQFTIPTGGHIVTKVTISMKKSGTPSDNVQAKIYPDSGGNPDTGTLKATSGNVAGSGLTTSYVDTDFTFSTVANLSAGTYWCLFNRSGANDDANCYAVGEDTGGDGGQKYRNNLGATYTKLWKVSVVAEDGTVGNVKKATATTNFGSDIFIGFAESAITAGNAGNIIVGGSVTTSGLTARSKYYLSDTAGAIATSAGTVTRKVGLSLSTTKLLITNLW